MESPNKLLKPPDDVDGFKKQFNLHYNQTEGNRASHFRRNERIDTDASGSEKDLLIIDKNLYKNNK